jgi:hypothetical protein
MIGFRIGQWFQIGHGSLSRLIILGAIALLLPLGRPSNALAAEATNTTNFTDSTLTVFTDQTTPVTDRVDDFATTIQAKLGNGTTVFDQTYSDPFAGPAVQAAIVAADAILTKDLQTFSAPVQQSTGTALVSSILKDVTGTPVLDGLPTTATTQYVGPITIKVGPNQSESFTLLPGQTDFDTLVTSHFSVPISAITTNTFLTSQTYLITGTPQSGPPTVPLPAAAWQAMIGMGALGLIRFRRWWLPNL